ncbi:MAG: peptidoglycan-binding protein [Myxococcales bacterium]|nr:peptidoglycan-binding protein [Myxococcales bacterium]
MAETRWLHLELVDSSSAPLAGRPYVLTLPDGAQQTGWLDAAGRLRAQVPADAAQVSLVVAHRRLDLTLGDLPPADTIGGAQERLNQLNYFTGNVDGELGPYTAGALRRFQRDHGLSETGELDPPTVDALLGAHGT